MITALKLLFCEYRRFTAIIMLIALLSVAAGLLGAGLLSQRSPLEPLSIAIVDDDNSLQSRMALSVAMGAVKNDMLTIQKTTQTRAARMLEAGELNAAFILPKGFIQSVLDGENSPIEAVYNPATPLSSMFIKTAAESALGLLRVSQSGIYTALAYTATHNPEAYSLVYSRINNRFISLATVHSSSFSMREVSATGDIPPAAYYIIHAVMFLHLISLPLLCAPMRRACKPAIMQGLRGLGRGGGRVVVSWVGAYTICLLPCSLLIAAVWYFAADKIGLPVNVSALACLPLFAALVAALCCLFALLFKSEVSGGAVACLLASVLLFVSGGVVPLSFLPEGLAQLAVVSPQYWACRLLGGALGGGLDTTALCVLLGVLALLLLLCAVCAQLRGRAVRA